MQDRDILEFFKAVLCADTQTPQFLRASSDIATALRERPSFDWLSIIEKEFSDFRFSFDKSMSGYVRGYRSQKYVASHILPESVISRMIADAYSRVDMMLSQSFMIRSLLDRRYSLFDKDGFITSTSQEAVPCLLNHDHRILIPFAKPDRADKIFLVCSEFWGQPCGIIDFTNRSYYSDNSSPKMRSEDTRLMLRSIVSNIINWHLSSSDSQIVDKPGIRVLLGGTVNLSHILWNYLGGIEVISRSIPLPPDSQVVQISDMLFPLSHINAPIFDLSKTPVHRHLQTLATSGLANGIWIRCSDAGINPLLTRKILSSHALTKLTKDGATLKNACKDVNSGAKDTRSISLRAEGQDLAPDIPTIAITLRSTNRNLVNQAWVLSKAVALVVEKWGRVNIIFDGCSQGAKSSSANELKILDCILKSDQLAPIIESGNLTIAHVIDLPLVRQTDIFSRTDTFLTYLSGGMVKFTGFCPRMGTAMGPSCDFLEKQSYGIEDLTMVNCINLPLIRDIFPSSAMFSIGHDHAGYGHIINPVNMLLGAPTASDKQAEGMSGLIERPSGIDSSFSLDPERIATSILYCLAYNRLAAAVSRDDTQNYV